MLALKTPGPYTRLTGAFGEMDELALEITADVPTRMALLCAGAGNSSVQQVFMHIALDVDNRDVTVCTMNPHPGTLHDKVTMDLVHNSCTAALRALVEVEHSPEWASVDDLKTHAGDFVATTGNKTSARVGLTRLLVNDGLKAKNPLQATGAAFDTNGVGVTLCVQSEMGFDVHLTVTLGQV